MANPNIKKYSDGAVSATINQIRRGLAPLKPNSKIVDICESMLSKASKYEKACFIKTFNRIIYETNKYFVYGVPLWLKPYYKEFFAHKMHQIFINGIFKKCTNFKLSTHLKNLFDAYMKKTVLLNWKEYGQKHFYMNKNFPYDVK